MTTISIVCKNLFTTTTLTETKEKLCRGARRNLARIVYRQGRRPGLVNPLPTDQLPPRGLRSKVRTTQCVQLPMRHVYKLHEPPRGKLRWADVAKLLRK